MPIVDILDKNCELYGNEVALVEINPEVTEKRRVTWKEYNLIESNSQVPYRREITWNVFNEKANRFANLLVSRGVKKGDKVAILLMNCLEWLPIYFGILKTGALAVPLNFRYAPNEIKYCLDLAEVDILVFGPEFIGRVEEIADDISKNRLLFFVGNNCPTFAEGFSILQTINIFVGIFAVGLFPPLARKFGRKKVLYGGFVSMLIGLGLFSVAGNNLAFVLIAAELFYIPQPII